MNCFCIKSNRFANRAQYRFTNWIPGLPFSIFVFCKFRKIHRAFIVAIFGYACPYVPPAMTFANKFSLSVGCSFHLHNGGIIHSTGKSKPHMCISNRLSIFINYSCRYLCFWPLKRVHSNVSCCRNSNKCSQTDNKFSVHIFGH